MDDRKLKPGDRDYVGALASGLEVLQAFDAEHPRMTLSEVATRTGMDRAKARRFLLTLHALGFVKRSGRQFELTPRVMRLGYAYQSSNQYRAVIQQYLEGITAELGESSSLAVLDGDDVVYVVRSAARHRLMAISLAVGTRLPAAYTSMGRVLLAQLPDPELEAFLARVELHRHTPASIVDREALRAELLSVREAGYAIVDQELDLGLRSVAVPVFSGAGELLGAINISTNAVRVDMATVRDSYLPRLQAVAEQIRQATR
ncbi:IclR family transcriptional regulator C-terminal domain-containing protein [Marinobacter lutaoensis]|jgi:IclR family pca regulon transcriptional regulator|uniref:IclR family transcriptional regulator n=1 Tax=Marinobacter lutaoensis TaxID=135739 RepID=A0A1V2DWC8_9GAMM|nr:IclR family transcriptional regulator C-terminal domain-containing protein [Marinobacter lutaoensis]MBE01866.1 IclR family transcriptional regulator [Marinobacter sp.]MBI41953.1 IclR family transcriptional regulator [Oceanospirillales bacterium]NVD36538.1 helix-turn-helix domain-containing protein [Marinobacter lutaoensis]ONF44837.1 IclR family transcriptional regulator [Marinobacter lutaoensis]